MEDSAADLAGLLHSLRLGGGSGTAAAARTTRVAPHVLAVPRSKPASAKPSKRTSGRAGAPSSGTTAGSSSGGGSSSLGGAHKQRAAPPAGAAPAANSSSGGSSGRHNVGRIPELDYFARKLAGPPEAAPQWRLRYGKAGDVASGGLPDVHASPEAYLTAMQAHTALEFQVGWPPGCGLSVRQQGGAQGGLWRWLLMAVQPPAPASPCSTRRATSAMPHQGAFTLFRHAGHRCRPPPPARWRRRRASTPSRPKSGGPSRGGRAAPGRRCPCAGAARRRSTFQTRATPGCGTWCR